MSDLIRREDAIQTLKSMMQDCFPEAEEELDAIVTTVREIPSAEPERKRGKWEVQPSTGEDRPFIWWKCSKCGHVIFSETERDRKEFHAFCGRCGADMRGE